MSGQITFWKALDEKGRGEMGEGMVAGGVGTRQG